MGSAPPGADKRGWILSFASGLACIIGSSIICIDLITRYIPRLRSFKVRKSKTFLSASLSLSFGVMIFSALYSILPEASVYFSKGGKTPEKAKLLSIGWFMLGVISLSIVSEVLHRYLPSSIVHCEHSDGTQHEHGCDDEQAEEEESSDSETDYVHNHTHSTHDQLDHSHTQINDAALNRPTGGLRSQTDIAPATERSPLLSKNRTGRPSLTGRLSSVTYLITNKPPVCTADGKCYGFSQNRPCAGQCLPHIKAGRKSLYGVAGHHIAGMAPVIETDGVPEVDLERGRESTIEGQQEPRPMRAKSANSVQSHDHSGHDHSGHHHVPKNEFLNIGVQTSLAIALHKIPEGFITFATNHANPNLGFAVFLALFIHNISEGFAMSVPLFMALKSRPKAMFYASLFGGLSQPIGALTAFLWFKAAGQAPSEVVYGALFAVTAGIMANVAVQLYGQAVAVYHNQKLPLICAFVGMGILGMSFAMTSD